jgi:hypothetical protein
MRVTSRTARGPVQTGLWTLRPCGTRETHSLTYNKVKWTKRRGPVSIDPDTGETVVLPRHLVQNFPDRTVEYYHGYVP